MKINMIGIKRKEESVSVTSIETVITEFDKKKIQVESLFIECGMSTILVVRSKCVSWKIRVHFTSLEPTPPYTHTTEVDVQKGHFGLDLC